MLKPMIDLPFQPITWGGEPHDFTKQNGDHNLQLGLYTKETTQRYICGTRSMTWDGRVYRYAKCGHIAITANKFGVANNTILIAHKVAIALKTNHVVMTDANVGDTSIKVTFDTGSLGNTESIDFGDKDGVLAENELCGGYISLYTGVYRQNRGIIGNTESTALSESMIIYLDAPLDHVLTAGESCYCEILANPYGNVGPPLSAHASIVGMPNVTAALKDYLWLQTWGPIRITGVRLELGSIGEQRQFVFGSNGVVTLVGQWYGNIHSQQHAGFLIERTWASFTQYGAAPFIMLQISP